MPIRTEAAMGTVVTIHVVRDEAMRGDGDDHVDDAIERAFGWFHEIESRCTRFAPDSELMQLTARVGTPVKVSPILFEAVQFALIAAEESGGAFDPTVGHRMEQRGFNRNYRTGVAIESTAALPPDISYRDVRIDSRHQTVMLARPLTLDLGAVAKGLAVDAAARELAEFRDFAIDAGGDLYLGGRNPEGEPWSVGIRHPRIAGETIGKVRVSNRAVCTSGDYEKRSADGGSHIVDPRGIDPQSADPSAEAAPQAASATVIAEGAMLADALATAAFVLGPDDGIRFLERVGVSGLIVTPDLATFRTRDFAFD